MNATVLFAVLQCWRSFVVIVGLSVILIFGFIPLSIAESSAFSVFPSQYKDKIKQPLLDEKGELTLHNAIQLALQHNPELSSFEKEALALRGLTMQAGLLPNPVIQFDSEDVSSRTTNSPAARFDSIRIFQLFETGGKRSARTQAAIFGQEVAEQDYAARQLDLIARVANTFMDVLTGQERLQLALAGQELAQKVVDAASKRVQAGKAPPIEQTRAEVTLATANIEVERTKRNLVSFRKQLALL